MRLHEYQAKQLLAAYGIAVPPAAVAATPDAARDAVAQLGAGGVVVKAQVHAGGRGRAGGIRHAADSAAVAGETQALLGHYLVTAQTGKAGLPIGCVLVEQAAPAVDEYYVSLVLDRPRACVRVLASPAGGMDIEDIARRDPARIASVLVDPALGLRPHQTQRLAAAQGLSQAATPGYRQILTALERLYRDQDASLIEINPLGLTAAGEWLALDAKIEIDDNALYRHPELAAWDDPSQHPPGEHAARAHGLNYIKLEGTIACMVNGAGLAMATMDLIQSAGGAPANFLDVGGGTDAARVAAAFKLILADTQVRAVLVNIFGGIVRCDVIAEGLISAVRDVGIALPVVVRLVGTEAARGRALLAASGLNLIPVDDLAEAARRAVAAAV